MIILIDNYDSFVYNLSRYFEELGYKTLVVRNDAITSDEIDYLQPSHIVLSPGPCAPDQAGICLDVVKQFKERFPIFGVCLGHQVIGQALGANIVKAKRPMHGMSSLVSHHSSALFKDINSPIEVGRYHSLVIEPNSLPVDFSVTASSTDGEIMAIEHASLPIASVQFHPESVMTKVGKRILQNFLHLTQQRQSACEDALLTVNG